jgi:hypothetical protein
MMEAEQIYETLETSSIHQFLMIEAETASEALETNPILTCSVVIAESLALLLCIWEVLGSDLSPEIGCPD